MAAIQFSPFTSLWENAGGSTTVIIGMPSSGKTFFMINLCANALLFEQRFFAIDPKDDMGVLSNIFPDKVEYININDIKPGALSPFNVIPDLDTNTLSSIISIICGNIDDQQAISITPILNDFVIRQKQLKKVDPNAHVSFSSLIDYLYANDNVHCQAIGTKLSIHRDSKYGKLIFDTEETANNKLSMSNKSKIISLHGMELPKNNDYSKMTDEQKFNSSIVFIITKMMRDILKEGKYPTMFVMDEAHIAFQNPAFYSIIDEFMVLGRSLNVPTILASQAVSHYPDGIEQFVSSKFCFKSSNKDANEFLNKFSNWDGADKQDLSSIVKKIGNFETGNCYFIDSRNRAGFVKITSLFGDDISSNPLAKKRRAEK